MRRLSDTLHRLAQMATPHMNGAPMDNPFGGHSGGTGRLVEFTDFGANPGDLRALAYVPDGLPDTAPLVVVLHGCTQTAAEYDRGSGWSQMADRHGFALLFPEQKAQNNPNRCFNWFSPEDIRRGGGEALSIRQMMGAMMDRHAIDPDRVFVTGLSAGGAMASVLLATYPELFAGGAIVAGLPYGSAATIPQAFDRMRGHGLPDAQSLAASVRAASSHQGPWPVISVWHGSADATVDPANGMANVAQWCGVHAIGSEPSRREVVDGYPRLVWCDREGRERIEHYSITGMGHGTPLATSGDGACGVPGAFMLDARISSTRHICAFWNIARSNRDTDAPAAPNPVSVHKPATLPPKTEPAGVTKVIEDALRAAGLMR